MRTAPTLAQIAAQIDRVLKRDAGARVVAIRSPTCAPWPERLGRAGRTFRLAWCESALATRVLLSESEGASNEGLVVLTALPESELGADLVARFAGARVHQVSSWQLVRDSFGAREIDPRLTRSDWMAELLLELMPADGYPPVTGDFLDADAAWTQLLDRALQLSMARPDAETLLRWTTEGGAVDRFAALSAAARDGVAEWLGSAAGSAGALVMACVKSGFGREALSLGLACDVVFCEGWAAVPELTAAAIRLERFAGSRVEAAAGRLLGNAALRAIRSVEAAAARRSLDGAERILVEIGAETKSRASSVLLSGFEARLAGFAAGLRHALAEPGSPAAGTALEAAAKDVLSHDQAKGPQAPRAERLAMALRLARWMRRPEPALPNTFAELARGYTGEGGYVDRARLALRGGDDLGAVSATYAELAEAMRLRRERENEAFARAFVAWSATPSPTSNIVPIERALTDIVAPLARAMPVLVVVIDGLSFSLFRELTDDLARLGWTELARDGAASVAVAMPPTITEVSRASLLCGRPVRGAASVEKAGFASHPDLVAASRSGLPPLLFHKGELGGDAGLAADVRDALVTRERRVVGVVYNAIDDHLDGPDQLRLRWTIDDLRLLGSMLREARNIGRVLVITADHGHVIDEGTTRRSPGGDPSGDRWRPPSPAGLEPREIALRRGRVVASAEEGVILIWSEGLRYGARKNGYHGGAAPQEVLIPLAVFSPGIAIDGWKSAPPAEPEWWDAEGGGLTPAPTAPPPMPTMSRQNVDLTKMPLFAGLEPAQAPAQADGWIDGLLASEVYAAQRLLASRAAPPDAQMRRLLEAMAERGGKLSRKALAQRLDLPTARFNSFLMLARRALNVDQKPVLSIDEESGTVVLDRGLLEEQFRLRRRHA
jgi:hypothetical protein